MGDRIAPFVISSNPAITQAEHVGVHIISCWEIAMLVEKGRLKFNQDVDDWINLALQHPKVTLLPFEPATAIQAARLQDFHGDPTDRRFFFTD